LELAGPDIQLKVKRLQSVQNTAARLVSRARHWDVSTDFSTSASHLRSLCSCGSVSIVLLLHICISGTLTSVSWPKTPEGARMHLLDVGLFSCREWIRHQRLTTHKLLSFALHYGPSVWNSLPSTLRDGNLTLVSFKGRLKTWPRLRPISIVTDN